MGDEAGGKVEGDEGQERWRQHVALVALQRGKSPPPFSFTLVHTNERMRAFLNSRDSFLFSSLLRLLDPPLPDSGVTFQHRLLSYPQEPMALNCC